MKEKQIWNNIFKKTELNSKIGYLDRNSKTKILKWEISKSQKLKIENWIFRHFKQWLSLATNSKKKILKCVNSTNEKRIQLPYIRITGFGITKSLDLGAWF